MPKSSLEKQLEKNRLEAKRQAERARKDEKSLNNYLKRKLKK